MNTHRRRPRLTEAEKTMLWNRWQQGNSLHAIARLLDTTHTSVRCHLVAAGGMGGTPQICMPRSKASGRQLTCRFTLGSLREPNK